MCVCPCSQLCKCSFMVSQTLVVLIYCTSKGPHGELGASQHMGSNWRRDWQKHKDGDRNLGFQCMFVCIEKGKRDAGLQFTSVQWDTLPSCKTLQHKTIISTLCECVCVFIFRAGISWQQKVSFVKCISTHINTPRPMLLVLPTSPVLVGGKCHPVLSYITLFVFHSRTGY